MGCQLRNSIVRLGMGLFTTALLALPAAAGPYSRLQVLLPGESPAPGTATGRTGTPGAQVVGVPFDITVRACDSNWDVVTSIGNSIDFLASDASATLPPQERLESGVLTATVTLNAQGTFTIYAHDATDGTIPDGASSGVVVQTLSGFQFSSITQKNKYAGQAFQTTLTARSPSGSIVTGYSGPVRLKEITSYGDGTISPAVVTLSAGTWTGNVTPYRADETSINRGNVNLYADLESDPSKNGTSDPFTVHPGPFSRLQLIVPGETPLPGSPTGRIGSPASQAAGVAFNVTVYATDNWWNPVPSADVVRITSSDPAASTPVSGALTNGSRQFTLSLGTVGTRTLTVSDQTNTSIQGMTSSGIQVLPSAADRFVIEPIAATVIAGVPVLVTIHAADVGGNTIPDFAGDAILSANTGAGSIAPNLVSFTDGTWSGNVVFRGAGGAVALSCADFSSPPHTGTSNTFTVEPGPLAGLQVLVPDEMPRGGTADGKEGTVLGQSAGAPFQVTVRAVDAFYNLVNGVGDRIQLGSTDAFATIPAETTLVNGQILLNARLYRTGLQRIWARHADNGSVQPDTSSAVLVSGGPFAKLLILAPGESPAPGTASGRTGVATDQSINYAFNVTVLATDSWGNPVGGVNDVVHLSCTDLLATLPPDAPLVDGQVELPVRLAAGGFSQITASDVSDPSKESSTTQVEAISSGFHLEASVSPAGVGAGEPFTLTVKVTNDAGSVIQEINSFVTIEVQNAATREPGRGTLLSTRFQLLQGQRSISQTYTFSETIVLVATDDAGNAPGITGPIVISPGAPAALRLSKNPLWVGGNKHAAIQARVVDAFENGVPSRPVLFDLLIGTGTLTPMDSLTGDDGVANADFLSPREPEVDRIRARSNGLSAEIDIEVAFVDPYAGGGTIASYPNPFHPGESPTTIAYKLKDPAAVTLQIFTLSGDRVRRVEFARAQPGGMAGLNTFVWDGRNGEGKLVSSGGYIVRIEAQGEGETMHRMSRKIGVIQ